MRWFLSISLTAFLLLTIASTPFPRWMELQFKKSELQKLAKVHTDLRLISITFGHRTKSAKNARFQIFKKHDFSSEQYSVAVNSVKGNPDLWLYFQQEVIKNLHSIEKKMFKKKKRKPRKRATKS